MLNKKIYPKSRVRKILLVIFALIFLVAAVACGNKDSEDADSKDDPAVTAPDSEGDGAEPGKDGEGTTGGEKGELGSKELESLFQSGKSLEEVSYTMEMTGYNEEPIMTKVWLNKDKMRFESTIMNQTVISIITEDTFYSISVNEKMAMKMPIGDVEDPMDNTFSLDDITEDVDTSSFTYSGKEKINGINCLVVESDEEGVGTIKMWLHEEYGLPMKVETAIRDQVGSYVMEIKEFSVGSSPDSIFEVPEGYQIMDFGDLEFPMLPDMPDSP